MANPQGPKEDIYIDIPLGGLDTSVADEQVEVGKALYATDVSFRKAGQVSRRPAFTGALTNISGVPQAIAPLKDQLAIFAKDGSTSTIFTDTASPTAVEIHTSMGAPLSVRSDRVSHGTRPTDYWSSASIGDVTCVVFFAGDVDQGISYSSIKRSDDAEVRFMLIDTNTGAIIKRPTKWMAVGTSVCDLPAVPTVRAVNGFFAIFTSIAFTSTSPPDSSWYTYWNAQWYDVYAGTINTSGTTVSSNALIEADVKTWDVHCYPDEAAAFLYTINYTTAGASKLWKVSVSGAGAISTASTSITTGASTRRAQNLAVVYHNQPQALVMLAFYDCQTTGAEDFYAVVINDDLTGLGTFQLIHSASSSTYYNDVLPWQYNGSNIAKAEYLEGSGAFIGLNATGTSVALLWQAYEIMGGDSGTHLGTSAVFSEMRPCGIRSTVVNGTTASSSFGAAELVNRLTINSQLMMLTKPWFDGTDAYVCVGVAPPVIWRDGFWSGDANLKYHPAIPAISGSSAYQAAAFVARIPTASEATYHPDGVSIPGFLYPVASFNIDLQRHPASGGLIALQQTHSYSDGTEKFVLDIDTELDVPNLYLQLGCMHGVGGTFITVDPDPKNLLALPIDGGVWIPTGSHRLCDGMTTNMVLPPGLNPVAHVDDAYGGGLSITVDTPLASFFRQGLFSGKYLRNGVVEKSGAYFPGTTVGGPWIVGTGAGTYAGDVYSFHIPFAGALYGLKSSTVQNGGEPESVIYQGDYLTYTTSCSTDTNFFYKVTDVVDQLTSGAQNYQDVGELGAEHPAGATCATTRRDRVFYVDCDDPYTVRSSKLIGPKYWIEFNQNLYARIPDSEGAITALATMDDKVIVFTDTGVYYLVGEGPNNLGRGGWDPPRKIATSLGCINAKSVISFEGGVLFQSKRGIELLDRNLVVTYIGAPIERYSLLFNDSGTVGTYEIKGVVNIGKRSEIRFVTTYHASSNNTSCVLFVYNYRFNTWSQWNYGGFYDTSGYNTKGTAISTCAVNDIHYILVQTAGTDVYQLMRDAEDDGTFGGNLEDMRYTTAWVKTNGFSNFFRAKSLWLSGYLPSDSTTGDTITITVKYDYDEDVTSYDQFSISTDNIITTTSGYYNIRVDLTNQKCESVRVQLTAAYAGSSSTEQLKFVNLGLEIAPMEGPNKILATPATVS